MGSPSLALARSSAASVLRELTLLEACSGSPVGVKVEDCRRCLLLLLGLST